MAAFPQTKQAASLPNGLGTALHKRDRAPSSADLLRLENVEPAAKHWHGSAAPALEATLGEPMSAYFQRLAAAIDTSPFSAADSFEQDGIYLYKRPVRSQSNHAALLAQGGSVFHHCVIYVKSGSELVALEFGPNNALDVTANFLEEAPAAPVLCSGPAPQPDPQCLPMLRIALPHHSLDAQHVQQALRFAESRPYHALKNNCIAFADYIVRVLTGGEVRNAPLIFDLVAGTVPSQDSPLLAFLLMATKMTWFSVCDGSPLTATFLQQHPAALLPAPGSARPEAGQQGGLGGSTTAAAAGAVAATAAAAARGAEGAVAAACGRAQAPAAQAPMACALPADSAASEDSVWVAPLGALSTLGPLPAVLRSNGSSASLASCASNSSAGNSAGAQRFDPLGRAAPLRRAAASQQRKQAGGEAAS